jgi:asparagine synthase (glutamine-hydrolysing)
MLWTTPESLLEKLPLVNQTGNLIITADARIDNRDELIAALGLTDRPAEKIADSELILAAYDKWGEKCPEHLLGDFAFAIWDKRKPSLFCARDHFGVKPFYYYYQSNQTFIFASEMKALLCLPEVPRQVNEVRIADFLALMMEDKAITTYQDLVRLPPAHSILVSQEGIRLWSYWSLDPGRGLRLESDEAYAEAFRDIFTEAVRCRLRNAFPIGSQLSGGLDSSAVTCMARKLLDQAGEAQLHTFSNIFDTVTECDERPFINAVLAQGSFIPHYVHADQLSPLSNLDIIFQYEDEAFTGPSHFLPWGLNCAAHEAGVRIFLDGFDGDTTVSHGSVYFTELARQGQWETFFLEAKAISQHFDTSPHTLLHCYGLMHLKELAKQWQWVAFATAVNQIHQHFGVSRRQLFLQHGLKPLVPEFIQQIWRRLRGRGESVSNLAPLVNRSFAECIGFDERIQRLNGYRDPPLTVREDQWRSLTSGMFVFILEQVDRYAAAFSIEARHPFMDKRLIEFCLALPPEQKLHQGWSRMVMRRALANVLPETIQWRGGKTDLTPNFLHGLLRLDRHLLDEVILNKLGSIERYLDSDFLRAAYQRITSGGKVNDQDIMTLWTAVILALWHSHTKMTP